MPHWRDKRDESGSFGIGFVMLTVGGIGLIAMLAYLFP